MGVISQLTRALTDQQVRLVDLTNKLSATTPTLELPEPFSNLIDFSLEEVSAYNEPGPFWKHHNIHTGEHIGTHIDAPVHWATGREGKDVSQIEPARLIGPAVVLDFTAEAEQDADFLVDVSHIQEWEAEHGAIPDNAWVLFRTGWDRFAQDRDAFLNKDENGPHSPGFTVECARWLGEERAISGVGVETVGIDAGAAGGLDPAFPMHYYLLGNDKYGITSLQNLGELPPTGALLVVAPLPIEGGTGSPSRVFALMDAE
ncbi:cyclase [Kocuria sp. WRN011]|uniref:cyclase family protein n=1 Tax=Kocuria TaxID=57493 RepID=UPI000BAE9402|nr:MULTISPECIES: cyclase family protein [Kocuria]PBB08498.1 cyclase [Kocuria sp. WRN011]